MQPATGLVINLFRNRCGETNDIMIQGALQLLLALH